MYVITSVSCVHVRAHACVRSVMCVSLWSVDCSCVYACMCGTWCMGYVLYRICVHVSVCVVSGLYVRSVVCMRVWSVVCMVSDVCVC